ncbi:hypothetical protein KUCAC02_037012, partial [Chaenocephalus aceratus]
LVGQGLPHGTPGPRGGSSRGAPYPPDSGDSRWEVNLANTPRTGDHTTINASFAANGTLWREADGENAVKIRVIRICRGTALACLKIKAAE